MAEASWKEDRRSELAGVSQREKNFSSAILRLQKDLELSRRAAEDGRAAAAAAERRTDELREEVERWRAAAEAGAIGNNSAGLPPVGWCAARCDGSVPTIGYGEALAVEAEAEAAALRQRVAELESQCQQGVKLIGMLKRRLEQQATEQQAVQQAAAARATGRRTSLGGPLRTPKIEPAPNIDPRMASTPRVDCGTDRSSAAVDVRGGPHATPETRGVGAAGVQGGAVNRLDAVNRLGAEVRVLRAELRQAEGAARVAEAARVQVVGEMEERVRVAEETARAASHGMLAAAARARRAGAGYTPARPELELQPEAAAAREALAVAERERAQADARLKQVRGDAEREGGQAGGCARAPEYEPVVSLAARTVQASFSFKRAVGLDLLARCPRVFFCFELALFGCCLNLAFSWLPGYRCRRVRRGRWRCSAWRCAIPNRNKRRCGWRWRRSLCGCLRTAPQQERLPSLPPAPWPAAPRHRTSAAQAGNRNRAAWRPLTQRAMLGMPPTASPLQKWALPPTYTATRPDPQPTPSVPPLPTCSPQRDDRRFNR